MVNLGLLVESILGNTEAKCLTLNAPAPPRGSSSLSVTFKAVKGIPVAALLAGSCDWLHGTCLIYSHLLQCHPSSVQSSGSVSGWFTELVDCHSQPSSNHHCSFFSLDDTVATELHKPMEQHPECTQRLHGDACKRQWLTRWMHAGD